MANNSRRSLTAMTPTSQAPDDVPDVSLDSGSAPSLPSVDSENDLIVSMPRLGTLPAKYPAHLIPRATPTPHWAALVPERRRSLYGRASSSMSRRMAGHTIGTGGAVGYSLTRSPIFFLTLYTQANLSLFPSLQSIS